MDNSINDPYDYLNKGDFTSELYKIEIKNLHPKVGFSQLKQRLKSIGLKPHKVKIMKDYSFVTFKCAEDRDEALQKVAGHSWKGNVLTAKIAKARASPYVQNRQIQIDDEESVCKKIKLDDESEEDKLKDHVIKFWRKPYENQLIAKENKIQGILHNLYAKINKENQLIRVSKNYFSEVDKMAVICPMLPIIKSPVETCYRNKCEFTIGMTLDNKGPIAGFCHGKYRKGFDAVGDSRCVPIVPPSMNRVLERVNELLSELLSPDFQPQLSSFSPATDKGHLRGITLRTSYEPAAHQTDINDVHGDESESVSRDTSVLVVMDINPQELSETELQQVADHASNYFSRGNEGEQWPVSSFLLTVRKNNSDPVDWTTTRVLFGSGFVFERLMGLNFRISFNAFFQVNSRAAEMLYSTIRNLLIERVLQVDSDRKKKVTLIDVCCGTGTIGLAMADLVDNVVGVELCSESVIDARYNAQLNNISNARFHVGKAEDLLANLLVNEEKVDRSDGDESIREFVAIADPPRAGLHGNVIQALRRCELINKIVFVSCNPEAAASNFVDFARPISKRTHGCPFVPEVSVPVDLFPQTPHVELVVLLTRLRAVDN